MSEIPKEDLNRESRKKSIYDEIPTMDKEKAMKYIIRGILIVIIFGIIIGISISIMAFSDTWMDMASLENKMNYWNGDYGYSEYILKENEIDRIGYWMIYQTVIFVNIGRIGIYVGFFFVFIGLMGFVSNETMDQRTRWICLILAGTIIISLVVTLMLNFSTTIEVN